MADLQDLQKFADEIVPILRDLFAKAAGVAAEAPAVNPALDAVAKLQKLVAEAASPTAANNVDTARAVTAVRGTLLAVLTTGAGSNVALAQTDVNTLEILFDSLEGRAGRLLEQQAFTSIATLTSGADLNGIRASLQQAEAEIRARRQAKDVLDAVIKTVIVAAQIAAKIAV